MPDGEPTLDLSLGEEIAMLEEEAGVRTAVLTNASLLWLRDVRSDLSHTSYVSLKVDAGDEDTWRRIDRPSPRLDFERVLRGILVFSREYRGGVYITTETMLVSGVNDDSASLEKIAEIVSKIEPRKAYLLAPTRPPAETWVKPPTAEKLVEAYELFRQRGLRVELLASPEPPPSTLTGEDPVDALYRTLSVHPLPVDVVRKILAGHGLDPEEGLSRLTSMPGVAATRYMGRLFLVRRPGGVR